MYMFNVLRIALFLSCFFISASVFAADDITIRVEEKVIIRSNPHKMDDDSCKSCHIVKKGVKQSGRLVAKDIADLCNACHKKEKEHFFDAFPYSKSHFEDKLVKTGIINNKKSRNCISCHDKHSESKKSYFLLNPVYDLFSTVKRIDPHWVENYCYACHQVSASRSASVFKFGGDIVKLCNNCHGTISNESYVHAVGMTLPREMMARKPIDFPLSKDKKVSCITCHELKYQCLKSERKRKEKDSRFFRGGPYASRTDLCYKCHKKESYEALNPHDQINDAGELNEDICYYCHEEQPDPQKDKSINEVKFVMEELKDLCYRCHRERPHPGGQWINFDHLVTPPKKVRFWINHTAKAKGIVLPLEPGTDKIFCCTCHNPHERGVLKDNHGKGADDDRRLRLFSGFELCDACHTGKGYN